MSLTKKKCKYIHGDSVALNRWQTVQNNSTVSVVLFTINPIPWRRRKRTELTFPSAAVAYNVSSSGFTLSSYSTGFSLGFKLHKHVIHVIDVYSTCLILKENRARAQFYYFFPWGFCRVNLICNPNVWIENNWIKSWRWRHSKVIFTAGTWPEYFTTYLCMRPRPKPWLSPELN
jgi:hypothetical protein